MKITVDSRGCGEGKTTLGIYPLIRRYQALNELTLLVVPSHKLQDEYQIEFQNEITIIRGHGAVLALYEALENKLTSVICITEECWRRSDINQKYKQQFNLIIDEAINPFRSVAYDRKKSQFDWTTIFQMNLTELQRFDELNYYPFTIDESAIDNWTQSSEAIKRLTDKNYTSEMSAKTYDKLKNGVVIGRAEIFQQLKIEMIENWRSVHIAAAAFEYTMMNAWLNFHKKSYRITHEFNTRELPVKFHFIEGLNWSKKKQLDPAFAPIKEEYKNYVNEYCSSRNKRPLALRNKISNTILENEQKINHNPHGWNQFRDFTAISLESALNPTAEFKKWLEFRIGMAEKQVTRAFSAYLFYQCIMRTCLRNQGNTTEVDVFCIDEKTLSQIFLFITPIKFSHAAVAISTNNIPSSYVKKIPKIPMTSTERSRKRRLKQKETTSNEEVERASNLRVASVITTNPISDVPKQKVTYRAFNNILLPNPILAIKNMIINSLGKII